MEKPIGISICNSLIVSDNIPSPTLIHSPSLLSSLSIYISPRFEAPINRSGSRYFSNYSCHFPFLHFLPNNHALSLTLPLSISTISMRQMLLFVSIESKIGIGKEIPLQVVRRGDIAYRVAIIPSPARDTIEREARVESVSWTAVCIGLRRHAQFRWEAERKFVESIDNHRLYTSTRGLLRPSERFISSSRCVSLRVFLTWRALTLFSTTCISVPFHRIQYSIPLIRLAEWWRINRL